MTPSGPLACLLTAVKEAGSEVLALQKTNYKIAKKANNDIVTQADLLANEILQAHLLGQYPDYGWLSEESVDDESRFSCDYVWIIDPIDGTKEFANGIPEYAISVALVKLGIPIVAAVFNPATDELFYAERGKGAWLGKQILNCSNTFADYKNGHSDEIIVLASRSEFARGEWDAFLPFYNIKQMGSIAYKLALVAAGIGHATFSLGPKNEWDIAAGVLLVSEAKGTITDSQQKIFQFNQENVLVDGIIAALPTIYPQIYATINQIIKNR